MVLEISKSKFQTEYLPVTYPFTNRWYGMERTEVLDLDKRGEYDRRNQQIRSRGQIPEEDFQLDCVTSIMGYSDSPIFRFVDLGAGWGYWGLVVAGLASLCNKASWILAVEPEINHYNWTIDTLTKNKVKGEVQRAAISDTIGKSELLLGEKSSKDYGQTLLRSKNPLARLLLRRKLVSVDKTTLDRLLLDRPESIDLAMVDVQGEELRVLRGSTKTLTTGQINFLMIGTHSLELHSQCQKEMDTRYPGYDLIVDLNPNSVTRLVQVGDGLLLYERRANDKKSSSDLF